MDKFQEFLSLVQRERIRQENIHGEHDKDINLFEWCGILGEEFGEVCHAVNEKDFENLKDELVQVAAVCQSIYERMEILWQREQ